MDPDATWPMQGAWYNELGSTMVINPLDPQTQTVTGTYTTAVSSTGCAKGGYPLAGRSDVQIGGQTFGWTVCWQNASSNCYSTTSWSGKLVRVNGIQTLSALWLLVIDTKDPNDWASTYIGHDVFTRTQPGDDAIEQALQLKRHAHP